MDRGAWWATVHRVTELDMTEQLTYTHTSKLSFEGCAGTRTYGCGDRAPPPLEGPQAPPLLTQLRWGFEA